MVRVALTVQTPPYEGAPTMTAPDAADGASFANDGHTVLLLRNTDGNPRTITVVSVRSSNHRLGDLIVVVPAGEVGFVGPLSIEGFNQSDQTVHLDVDDSTGLTMAAVRALTGALPESGNEEEPAPAFVNTYSVRFNDDTVNEYVTVGDLAIVDLATALTVSWWQKHEGSVPASGTMSPWGKFDPEATSTESPIHCFQDFTNSFLYIYQRGTNQGVRYTMPTFVADTWHHLAMSFDGATPDIDLYFDGALYTTGKTTVGSIRAQLNDGVGNPFVIGARRAADMFFTGIIDELAVWDSALDDAAVSTIHNGGSPTDLSAMTPAPNHWWRMGDGDTYPTISDQIGSNDGTMTNMESGDIVEDAP